jgi:hypothetical protein
MFYRTNAEAIRPLHEWTSSFERFWRHQLNQIKELAERNAKKQQQPDSPTNFKPRSKHDLDRDKN